jgi:hypothetical protein
MTKPLAVVGAVVWWQDRACRAKVTSVSALAIYLVPLKRGPRNGAVIVATWDDWSRFASSVQSTLF